MSYEQSIDTCLATDIGERGLNEVKLTAALEQTLGGLVKLRARRGDGSLLTLPGRRDDLAALRPVIARYRDLCSDLLVLGTGGSSPGGHALYALADRGDGPRIHFLENPDPWCFDAAFIGLDLETTGVIVISESGGTSETMLQFANTLSRYRKTVDDAAVSRLFTVITEPGDNPLRRLAGWFAIPCLDHDREIGGRFSALSPVGLLPAAIAGVDIEAVREGAAQVLEAALAAENPKDSALGFRQLRSENLGKDGKGATPIDEQSLGVLMMNFMLETIVAKHMMGVDPFDQPADDEGKDRARR
jgi:glucose-6-phosphate isomerase